ncbi:PAZ domain-containing protein [Roridomyces roridus]|uniref:PAZ domain-containing protein n=1 Tax=Roridomyces roridus TaxID=1738132 RepID=A0AAD7BWY5_9AGAR|nr:PAZ domain-containing protein [Roridomyces roridus]
MVPYSVLFFFSQPPLPSVQFIPDIPIANKRQRVIQSLQTKHPNIFNPPGVYDNKNEFYSPQILPLATGGSGSFLVNLGNAPTVEGNPGVFKVVLERTIGLVIRPSDIDDVIRAHNADQPPTTNITTAINLLNLLFRQDSNQFVRSYGRHSWIENYLVRNHPNNGRAFFPPNEKKNVVLGEIGLELCRGFYQSVRPTTGALLITIDTVSAVIYRQGGLIGIASTLLGHNNAGHVDARKDLVLDDPRHLRTMQTYLKLRRVKCTHTGGDHTKTVYDVIPGPIGERRFKKDGYTITIAEYLWQFYTIRLRYPKSFGVKISGPNANFEVILPAELIMVLPGQFYRKRLPPGVVDDMVRFATTKPGERYEAITGNDSPIHSYQLSQHIQSAGMQIDVKPVVLPARLLSPPRIQFNGSAVEPRNGSWNVVRRKFRTVKNLATWGVLNLNIGMRRDVGTVVNALRACGEELGMKIEEPICIEGNEQAPEQDLDRLVELIRQAAHPKIVKIDMIVVMLRTHAEEPRIRVKHWGDIKV